MRLAFSPIELVHGTVTQTVVAAYLQIRMQKQITVHQIQIILMTDILEGIQSLFNLINQL